VVGQASLYHHFNSKETLADAAMREFAAELGSERRSAIPRIRRGSASRRTSPRRARRCAAAASRRLAFDPAVVASPALRAILATYLTDTVDALVAAFAEARANDELAADADVRALAGAVAASVQGADVLARGAVSVGA
jgi:AcrR family transcriptional regulator